MSTKSEISIDGKMEIRKHAAGCNVLVGPGGATCNCDRRTSEIRTSGYVAAPLLDGRYDYPVSTVPVTSARERCTGPCCTPRIDINAKTTPHAATPSPARAAEDVADIAFGQGVPAAPQDEAEALVRTFAFQPYDDEINAIRKALVAARRDGYAEGWNAAAAEFDADTIRELAASEKAKP